MGTLSGGRNNYYLVQVLHPQREDQAPYQAECEDIADALGLTPNEFCEFKAIWRTAAARLGNGKPDHKALYDAQKRVHYATRDMLKLQRELDPLAGVDNSRITAHCEPVIEIGTVVEGGWIVHGGNDMPEPLSAEQLVEVRIEGGQEYTDNFAKPAGDWKWFTDGRCLPITHYRLLHFNTGSPMTGELDLDKELVGNPGWYQHDGGPRPAGVAQLDRVKVRLSDGHEMAVPREAYKWNWEYRQATPTDAPHIEAWRFV